MTEAQIALAYSAFLHENNLGPKTQIPDDRRKAITGRPSESAPPQLRLAKIGQLQAVNALPDSALLIFSSNFTVIYGGNGVGKSGFARILSNACFSRTQQPILSDIYKEGAQPALGAELTVADGDGNETPLHYRLLAAHRRYVSSQAGWPAPILDHTPQYRGARSMSDIATDGKKRVADADAAATPDR